LKKQNKQLDLMDLLKPPVNQNQRFTTKHAVHIHEFYVSGEIESPEDYIEWFDIIRSAGPNDVLKFYINSPGGDLFTAIQFMRVLDETEANIVVSVEGACMSAATLIFLCGESFEVSEHSMFMFHNYSSGVQGKGGEMYDRLAHEKVWSEKLLRDVYSDFLTEKEITSVLDNKDIWMDGEEVVKRLKAKVEKLKAEHDEDQTEDEDENEEIIDIPHPKKRRASTKKSKD
jgi:ATP-dependent Clp protease, protease subunit